MKVIPNHLVYNDFNRNIALYMKREDLIDPFVSGNKFRKLKYNLLQAKIENHTTLLTFGGAFSNHIAAVAAAGHRSGFQTIGIIRGEELDGSNPTLAFAIANGMRLHFISRAEYDLKTEAHFLQQLKDLFGSFYLIPEGGTNELAIRGCTEILNRGDETFDYICCPVGTGGTISGISNSAFPHQKVLGFPALKGDFLQNEIRKFATKDNWELITDYHFGGYAKISGVLVDFMNDFRQKTQIVLDPVYTAKMVFGVMDRIEKGFFKSGSQILMIHTGGLQGIPGMNQLLEKKNLPKINTDD